MRADLELESAIDALYVPLWLRLIVGHQPLTPKAADSIVDVLWPGLSAAPSDGGPPTPPNLGGARPTRHPARRRSGAIRRRSTVELDHHTRAVAVRVHEVVPTARRRHVPRAMRPGIPSPVYRSAALPATGRSRRGPHERRRRGTRTSPPHRTQLLETAGSFWTACHMQLDGPPTEEATPAPPSRRTSRSSRPTGIRSSGSRIPGDAQPDNHGCGCTWTTSAS